MRDLHIGRRAQRVLSMSLMYAIVLTAVLTSDLTRKPAFVVASGAIYLAVGIGMDRYHERSGHNEES